MGGQRRGRDRELLPEPAVGHDPPPEREEDAGHLQLLAVPVDAPVRMEVPAAGGSELPQERGSPLDVDELERLRVIDRRVHEDLPVLAHVGGGGAVVDAAAVRVVHLLGPVVRVELEGVATDHAPVPLELRRRPVDPLPGRDLEGHVAHVDAGGPGRVQRDVEDTQGPVVGAAGLDVEVEGGLALRRPQQPDVVGHRREVRPDALEHGPHLLRDADTEAVGPDRRRLDGPERRDQRRVHRLADLDDDRGHRAVDLVGEVEGHRALVVGRGQPEAVPAGAGQRRRVVLRVEPLVGGQRPLGVAQ